ncbi:hypothetical protein D3C71_1866670 [compost metagenome]
MVALQLGLDFSLGIVLDKGVGALAMQFLADKAGQRVLRRQGPLRHIEAVRYAAGDDGTIGIAIQVLDHHLLADARHVHRPEAIALPRRRHPHPA